MVGFSVRHRAHLLPPPPALHALRIPSRTSMALQAPARHTEIAVMKAEGDSGSPFMRAIVRNAEKSLPELVDSYQASGRYVLVRDEAIKALGLSQEALKKAVQRLVARRRLAAPRRGFFVIV